MLFVYRSLAGPDLPAAQSTAARAFRAKYVQVPYLSIKCPLRYVDAYRYVNKQILFYFWRQMMTAIIFASDVCVKKFFGRSLTKYRINA
jgi:hypothetical protein